MAALLGIGAWVWVAGGADLPRTALILPLLAAIAAAAALSTRHQPRLGWIIGAGLALVGCLAGSHALVSIPALVAAGEPVPIATVARAAVATTSYALLLVTALAVLRRLRQKRKDGPLAPIGWR